MAGRGRHPGRTRAGLRSGPVRSRSRDAEERVAGAPSLTTVQLPSYDRTAGPSQAA
jgi:hypothetical protein